jgi:hypothetical protein
MARDSSLFIWQTQHGRRASKALCGHIVCHSAALTSIKCKWSLIGLTAICPVMYFLESAWFTYVGFCRVSSCAALPLSDSLCNFDPNHERLSTSGKVRSWQANFRSKRAVRGGSGRHLLDAVEEVTSRVFVDIEVVFLSVVELFVPVPNRKGKP